MQCQRPRQKRHPPPRETARFTPQQAAEAFPRQRSTQNLSDGRRKYSLPPSPDPFRETQRRQSPRPHANARPKNGSPATRGGQVHPTASSRSFLPPKINPKPVGRQTKVLLPPSPDPFRETRRRQSPRPHCNAKARTKNGSAPTRDGQVRPIASSRSFFHQRSTQNLSDGRPKYSFHPRLTRFGKHNGGKAHGLTPTPASKTAHPRHARRPGSPHSKQQKPFPAKDQHKCRQTADSPKRRRKAASENSRFASLRTFLPAPSSETITSVPSCPLVFLVLT